MSLSDKSCFSRFAQKDFNITFDYRLAGTECSEYLIPSESLGDEAKRLADDDDATQENFDRFSDKVGEYADSLSEDMLVSWFVLLNDPVTIVSSEVEED